MTPLHVARCTLRAAALGLAAACAPEAIPAPPPGFDHAAATRECGPADGPAVAVYLAGQPVDRLEPAPPYVRLYVWHALGDLTGRTWSLAGNDADGSAQYCPVGRACQVATDGSVTVGSVAADSSLEGSVDLTFPGAGPVAGGIRARWITRVVFCG